MVEEATQSSSIVTDHVIDEDDHVSDEDVRSKFADKGTQAEEVSYECRVMQTCNPQL